MTTQAPAVSVGSKSPLGKDIVLVFRQLYYEQIAFWRNPIGAIFTVVFSIIFLVLLAAGNGNSHVAYYGNLSLIQYYVPGFAAYGVMSACFNNLAIVVVVRRETGLLKRLRLAPIPNWVMFGGLFLNAAFIASLQIFVLLMVGRFGYHVHLPSNYLAFIVTILIGVFCFTALAVALSTVIPNQEAAGPLVSIVFFVLLFVSGLWFPLQPGSGLAKVAGYFPMRHMILATFAPFNLEPGVSAWSGHDLLVLALWGAAGVFVSLRRFRWEPRKR